MSDNQKNNSSIPNKKDLEKLKELLQIPPEKRNLQCIIDILDAIKNIKFLESYLHEKDKFLKIASNLKLVHFDFKQTIFRQGDIGDAFYIILEGKVKVFLNVKSNKHFQYMKEIMELKPGDSFGEIALLYESTRSATVIASDSTCCIVLDKATFQKYMKDYKGEHLTKIIQFYENYKGFKSLQSTQIASLAAKSMLQKLPSDTILIRQGEIPKVVYFILSGRVKAIKRLDFRIDPQSKNLIEGDFNNPSPEEIANGNYKSHIMELDELGVGSSLCTNGVIYNLEMDHTLTTIMPCEIITLPVFNIPDIIPSSAIEEMKNLIKVYPSSEELKLKHFAYLKWINYKKAMLIDTKIESYYKKSTFYTQLRKPIMQYQNHINPFPDCEEAILQDNKKEILACLSPKSTKSTDISIKAKYKLYNAISPDKKSPINKLPTFRIDTSINRFYSPKRSIRKKELPFLSSKKLDTNNIGVNGNSGTVFNFILTNNNNNTNHNNNGHDSINHRNSKLIVKTEPNEDDINDIDYTISNKPNLISRNSINVNGILGHCSITTATAAGNGIGTGSIASGDSNSRILGDSPIRINNLEKYRKSIISTRSEKFKMNNFIRLSKTKFSADIDNQDTKDNEHRITTTTMSPNYVTPNHKFKITTKIHKDNSNFKINLEEL